jgi:glycosyltransferase involved in cell wall biosynthesis
MLHAMRRIAQTRADVVHGHGAKGGAYARFALNGRHAIRAYTPHGGSLHYDPATLGGKLFLGTEKLLLRRGDLYIFESAYSADIFRRKVGAPAGLTRIVHNGVGPAEFAAVEVAPDATDLLFVGELRVLKGVDLLLAAMARLRDDGRPLTATLVGAGPDRTRFEADAVRLGLAKSVSFPGPMPARQAFARGRLLVIPSRAESLPYIVLEAAAAGKPLLTTDVGGIREIFGPHADRLVPADDVAALADAIGAAFDRPEETAAGADALRARVSETFTIATMVDGVLAAYADALAARRRPASALGQFAASR